MPTTYEPIATNTLGSNATFITFSSIPGTYTDLRLVLVARNATGYINNYFYLQFNGDNAGNYSETYMLGYGSNPVSSGSSSNTGLISLGGINGVDEVAFGLFTADIFRYTGSDNKTVLTSRSADRNNTSGDLGRSVGLWRNTSAITSVRIANSGGFFAAGTTATLYGIKNA